MEPPPICSIDSLCATQISSLLSPPSSLLLHQYYHTLLSSTHSNAINVQQDPNFGKGVYAAMPFNEGELVLKDHIFVGVQHYQNKRFRGLESCCVAANTAAAKPGVDNIKTIDCFVCSFCFRFIGSIELQIGRRLYFQELNASENHGCNEMEMDSSDEEESTQQCGSGSSSKTKIPLPEGVVESLMNGQLILPYSNEFPLPSPVPCHGGCGEAYYCSASCAEADWESSHSLLCTGERSDPARREALLKFVKHANETNDIFLLAAKAISTTILRYRKLKANNFEERVKSDKSRVSNDHNFSLLLEAWRPISMGYKRRWWDCVALPEDIDSSDEASFRMQIKELAFKSLQLLKTAIFDEECEPLFSLEIYGHIIGMFELNNLDLVVASPVEDYFLYIDDLTHPNKEEAEKITQPILDALGEDYSICCEGTAFFALQSCMNHSCCPNAKAFKRDEDRDGQATIIALRSISKGEEITISYVDEDLPYDERQASLADYGFRCRCRKCIEEEP